MSRKKGTPSSHFAEVPRVEIPRSSFDRSSGYKTTFDSAKLIPFFMDEALPGDTFNLKTSGFVRMATPIFPIMDNMYLETFYFAVPNRLVWDNWQKMMGEQDKPGDSTDYVVPQLIEPSGGFLPETLQDYMGIPIDVEGTTHSALWQRAYGLIFNEWFRDQNLQIGYNVDTGDGPDFADFDSFLHERGKRHDYFTSALPWPQKGPDIDIPTGLNETGQPISGIGFNTTFAGFPLQSTYETDATELNTYDFAGVTSTNGNIYIESTDSLPEISNNQRPAVYVNASSVGTGGTVNQLREAFQIQRLYEKDARGGTRYTEIVRSHFGVTSPDARLQRPEYLGGGSTPINISTIHSSAETDPTGNPGGRHLGALSGIGTGSFNGHGFTKSFTEHCIIIGLVNVRADLTYQQGMNRMFNRLDKLDYYWPSLSHLGEQEVLNKEIYLTGTNVDDEVFGYQERYAEMRYKPSIVTGKFRSNADGTLDAWHLSQDFEDLPTLSDFFIRDQPPLDRCLAVTDEPQFIGDFYHKLQCARPMPLYGVPGNIDRF